MSGSIYDWSTTAANNASADGDLTWAEGQAPSTVNDSARVMMQRQAQLLIDIGGVTTTGGTANALTVTAASPFTAFKSGLIVSFRATANNTAATTLNVNALGAKSIRKMGQTTDVNLAANDIVFNGIYVCIYSTAANSGSGGWMLQNPTGLNYNLITMTQFTGSTTWTPNARTQLIRVQLFAGGGGGGGALSNFGLRAVGAGGNGGNYREMWLTAWGSPPVTITVGAAGAAGNASGSSGGTGGATFFGTASAAGGNGGGGMAAGTSTAGPQNIPGSNSANSGTVGTALMPDINILGQLGGASIVFSGTAALAGQGGSSFIGTGDRGGLAGGGGGSGVGYGAGGSGGHSDSTTGRAGGAGNVGLVIITEYGF